MVRLRYRMADVFFEGHLGVCQVVALVPHTRKLREAGLRGFGPLDDGRGMLFWFGDTGLSALTMVKMRYPLDIGFVKAGRLVGAVRAVPGQRRIEPPPGATAAIELRAGYFRDHGIQLGSPVLIRVG